MLASMLVWTASWAATLLALETPVLIQGGRLNWPTEVLQHQPPGEPEAPVVTQLTLHPSLPLAAIVGDDHNVSLVNLDSGRLEKTLKGHSDWIRAAQFLPTGDRLITAGVDRRILSWDLQEGKWHLFASLPCSVEDISVSPDGELLAVVGFDNKLRIYETKNTQLVFTGVCPCSDMRSIEFSPSGDLLVAGGRCGTIRSWVRDQQQWHAMPTDIQAHRQRIHSIDFLDETTIIACSEDRTLSRCDLTQSTSRILVETTGRKFDVEIIDPRTVACCGSSNRIELFDTDSGESIGFLEGHKGTVTCIEYRDGRLLSGSFDTQARVWKTQQEVSIPGGAPDRTAAFDLPAIQRSTSSPSLPSPPVRR